MNLRPDREKEQLEVNLTPLIDVVFLLLIFFMVSTTFDQNSQLKLTLPEATSKMESSPSERVVLAIDAKGQYYINDKQLVNTSVKTLMQALNKTLDGNKAMPVVLKADANTPHHAVVSAMDAAAQLGITRLSIMTLERR